jgi:hypothetical protein
MTGVPGLEHRETQGTRPLLLGRVFLGIFDFVIPQYGIYHIVGYVSICQKADPSRAKARS